MQYYSKDITREEVDRILSYDPLTGIMRYKVARANGKFPVGSVAGYSSTGGYIMIGVNYKYYKAHRLAWLLYYGEWPPLNIDHINRDTSDNRIGNLRLCNQSQNSINSKMFKTNTSGVRGVSFRSERKGTKNWVARITHQGKKITLGYFYSREDAEKARIAVESRFYGEFSTRSP